MVTNWLPADKINNCNDDLIVTIIKVIAGNKNPTKNHVFSLIDLFGLNPKQLDLKIVVKDRWSLPFKPPTNLLERKERTSR